MKKSVTRRGKTSWDLWLDVEDDLELYISPAGWLDYVLTALLVHHHKSIEAGDRADGKRQMPLEPDTQQAKRAAAGKRPKWRGATDSPSNRFPDKLTRGRISQTTKPVRIGGKDRAGNARVGTSARGEIKPGLGLHTKWLTEEEARGVEYLFVTGEADEVIERAAREYWDHILDQALPYTDAEFTAEEEL